MCCRTRTGTDEMLDDTYDKNCVLKNNVKRNIECAGHRALNDCMLFIQFFTKIFVNHKVALQDKTCNTNYFHSNVK